MDRHFCAPLISQVQTISQHLEKLLGDQFVFGGVLVEYVSLSS